ncbi:MAG: cysteine desulfurase family protein [Flavobacteriaceae bacterium]|nr:cysteine desulfurase family protein [Flavobacteriaceae bacterium]
MGLIYVDNAATTAVFPEVVAAMHQTISAHYGNPSSIHAAGRSAKAKVESARKTIAKELGVLPQEIIFMSGGTEGDNTVIQSAVNHLGIKHVISSPIEHHAVLHPLRHLAEKGLIVLHMVNVLPSGMPDLDDLVRLLQLNDEKKLVSLMHVNNEVGTVIDLKKIGDLCHEHHALFHSDTVQSIGHFPMKLGDLPVDFAVASAHKFHGPKGIGFLYAKKQTGLSSILKGGSQERGMRAGTEAVHDIVGLETAFKIAYKNMNHDAVYLKDLKKYCIKKLEMELAGTLFNGACSNTEASTHTIVNARLPIDEKKANLLAFHLDLQGICCSKGSACQSGSETGSHVLQHLLTPEENKRPSLRFSFSIQNTKSEIDTLVKTLVDYANS